MSTTWDHSSHDKFLEYYAEKSIHPAHLQHFRSVKKAVLRVLGEQNSGERKYSVLDVGCNAGGQCSVWAEDGHQVHGLDINEPLLELGRKRAEEAGQQIDYRLGSATELPWPDKSMDVCIALELLEHVLEWQKCLREFSRVLRPGGVLFLSTSNRLCPRQQEFNLPLYSWYPGPLKRHFEHLAVTTRPDLANYAKYPAVNWFDTYTLGRELARYGLVYRDRFDIVDTTGKGSMAKLVISAIQALPPLRFLAHICTSSTLLLGVKQ